MTRMNKRLNILLVILLLFSPAILLSQDIKNYALGFSEAMFSNNLLWGFNRYVNQQDYGMISVNSVWENVTNPWVWDQDEFIVNHLGHPFQGSVYFSAGRSAGNGFWTSASLSTMGSLSWELLMETETPSINDLVITTFGGITTGEILFRFSEALLYGEDGSIENPGLFRRLGASVMSPFTGINEYFVPGKKTISSEIKGYQTFGIGKSYFRVGENTFSNTIDHSSGFNVNYMLNLNYGSPLTNRNKKPFDYFSLRGGFLLAYDSESFGSFFTEGLLYGKTWFSDGLFKHSLGLFLNYDFFMNRFINMSANGIGPGWNMEMPLGRNWRFKSSLYTNYIFLGASDIIFLKYNDIYLSAPDYERRNYSLCTGDNIKIELNLSRKERLFFDFQYSFYNFFIIDSSVPDGGSSGKEIIGMASLSCRQLIDEDFFVGIRGSIYHKDSFYDDYMNLHESVLDLSLFYGITF